LDFLPKYYGRVRELLKEIQYNKCAYCESTMGVAGDGNLHTFRPKSKFPELAYDWNNLLVACPICNSNKRDQFPVDDRGAPLLIDPAAENPAESISFDRTGLAYSLNRRGDVTIDILALNRSELVRARKLAIGYYEQFGGNSPDDPEPYAGAVRAALRTSKKRPSKVVSGGKSNDREKASALKGSLSLVRSKFSYIKSIHIKNFRAIKELKLEFPDFEEQRGWQVLLGENAAGKSTVLKAVALALMGTEHLAAVKEYQKGILRRYTVGGAIREAASGSVTIDFLDGEKTVLKISRSGLKFAAGGGGRGGTIRGYGSMRLLPEEGENSGASAARRDVGNLFHPRQTLVNAEKLLTGFYLHDRSRFEEFATQINYLLRLDGPVDVVNGELFVPINGTPVRIAELSDGYQAMIALVVDLMNGFADSKTLASASGILMLDELGTHLHPRWRLEFVKRLRATFPGLQVISTTHEPLCLCGLKKGEVGLLQRGTDACVEFVNGDELPNIEGMRVDQILTSTVFGLNSTIDPDIEADFVRYYELLATHDLTELQQIQLNSLATKLKPHRHLAYTRRDQMMYDVIDEFLAKEAKHPRKQKLRKDTMSKLWEIWNETGVPGIMGSAP
jgi:uncharacterized protein (TIGR02646 family)